MAKVMLMHYAGMLYYIYFASWVYSITFAWLPFWLICVPFDAVYSTKTTLVASSYAGTIIYLLRTEQGEYQIWPNFI